MNMHMSDHEHAEPLNHVSTEGNHTLPDR